jgi:intergrase/recombinase
LEYSKRYDPATVRGMVHYLDRCIKEIQSPRDIIRAFNDLSTGQQHHLNRASRALFNYLEIIGYDKAWLDRLRKAIPKDQTGIDLRVPEESDIGSDLPRIQDLLPKYRALWTLCLDSGLRLIEAIHIINRFDPAKVQAINGFYRYRVGEFRGTKQSYFAYFTEDAFRLIQSMNAVEIVRQTTSGYYSRHGVTSPKYLRKFCFDKMVQLEIPESIADFIEGRVATRVGARHYMCLMRQADRFYGRYADYLESLGNSNARADHVVSML